MVSVLWKFSPIKIIWAKSKFLAKSIIVWCSIAARSPNSNISPKNATFGVVSNPAKLYRAASILEGFAL